MYWRFTVFQRMILQLVVFIIAIALTNCVSSTSPGSTKKQTSAPTGSTAPTGHSAPDLSKLVRVAVVYDKSKNQMYWNGKSEFPVSNMTQSESDFRKDVEATLKKNVVLVVAGAGPTDFTLTLVKTLQVDQFGDINIYHWPSYDLIRGNFYTDASALMVFDNGGEVAEGTYPGMTTPNAKLSSSALKYILLDPSLVNELHNNGYKIPGEQDLYDTLRKIKPGIDVSKYPDLP